MTTFTLTGGEMDETEAAAALAALACLIDEEAALAQGVAAADGRAPGWREAGKLITQGLVPTRVPAAPRWSSIERLRRAGRGGGGVVGQ